jgi:hypothetical protein
MPIGYPTVGEVQVNVLESYDTETKEKTSETVKKDLES